MTTYFVDTSALAKRYVLEVGSTWVNSLIVPAANNVLIVTELTKIEMIAVFARKQRENTLSTADFSKVSNAFLHHTNAEYLVLRLDDPTLVQARLLVAKHPLRTLDAIQLSSALEAVKGFNEPMTFISADNNLLKIAAAEGFTTDNPNAHP